jgi:ribosomal silencing factor RsfS
MLFRRKKRYLNIIVLDKHNKIVAMANETYLKHLVQAKGNSMEWVLADGGKIVFNLFSGKEPEFK